MPSCGTWGGYVDRYDRHHPTNPGVNRGKGRGITKPPARKRRHRR